MMRKRHFCRLPLTLALALALLLSGAPVSAATRTGFPDVPNGSWYEQELLILQNYLPGIINGIRDSDGVLRFHPGETVTRGQFLKMAMTAAEGFTADTSRDSVHWAGRYYTIAMENNILVPTMFTENTGSRGGSQPEILFPCTSAALEEPVSRYEMAVILYNTCDRMLHETMVIATSAYKYITDYTAIDTRYVTAVEQAYGKGLLTGYDDGSFQGSNSLTRAEAAVVVYRLATGLRKDVSWAREPNIDPITGGERPAGFRSFAEWLANGHLTVYDEPDEEAKRLLFGDENKSYFLSVEEASEYIIGVSIPVWYMDKTGNKQTKNVTLVVNRMVEEEIKLIFQQIYADPERFPIESVGAVRFNGETGRHAWGCAVDINPYYNCEGYFYTRSTFTVTCGHGWWPYGMDRGVIWKDHDATDYHGTLTEASPYSISPYGSVVKAFSDYGWGWGGNGWGHGAKFDFMHFSVLPNGG